MNQLLNYMTNYIRENPLDPRHQRFHFLCEAKIINPINIPPRTQKSPRKLCVLLFSAVNIPLQNLPILLTFGL